MARAHDAGHGVTILASHHVTDMELREDDVLLAVQPRDGECLRLAFDHGVAATGHTLTDAVKTGPGWFASPYPTSALRVIGPVSVGLRGSSLSAIDATVAIAQAHGVFLRDPAGQLQYHPKPGTDALRMTLLSRKGLLPGADFYFPIPYGENAVCTPEAMGALVAAGRADLLDGAFDLFREELLQADPDYAARIGLAALDADSFAPAYFAECEGHDPFAWAALNLAEAKANYERQTVISWRYSWRYAILRTHEVVARIVLHLSAEDLKRFNAGGKAVFVDDYATVPNESIERLLALRRAGRVETLQLGGDYRLTPATGAPGADLGWADGARHFDALVEATGQRVLDARDLPFPSLLAQGAVRAARAGRPLWSEEDGAVETGGVDLDDFFRPVNDLPFPSRLHLLALPFPLRLHPFHRGLTSAEELGQVAAHAILAEHVRGKIAPGLVRLKRGEHFADGWSLIASQAGEAILRA